MHYYAVGAVYFICSTVLVPRTGCIDQYYGVERLGNYSRLNRGNQFKRFSSHGLVERSYHAGHLVFLLGNAYNSFRYANEHICRYKNK